MEAFWKKFDMILCINLREDTIRKQSAQLMFDKLKIPVEFMEVERHPEGGQKGCFDSHQKCMRKAHEAGCENVIIFEDDALDLRIPSAEALDEVSCFVLKNPKWEIFYLGSNPLLYFHTTSSVAGYKHIRGLHSMYAHAYIASRKYMEKFLQYRFEHFNCPIDVYTSMSNHAYAIFPTWFYQPNSSGESITKTIYRPDWFRRTIIDSKNWYACNVNIQLEYLMWIVIALFILLFFLLLIAKY